MPKLDQAKQPGHSKKSFERYLEIYLATSRASETEIVDKLVKSFGTHLDWFIERLRNSNPKVTPRLTEVIYQLGPSTIPELIELIGDDDRLFQEAIIGIIVRHKEKSAARLVFALRSENSNSVRAATMAIKLIGIDAVPELSLACDPSEEEYSSNAMDLLIEIDPQAMSKLTGHIAKGLGSDDGFMSTAAIQTFAAMGSAVVPALVGYLEQQNAFLQQNATHSLTQIGLDAVPELVKGIGSSNQLLQQNSVNALRRIGGPAVPELLKAAASGDYLQTTNAVKLLEEISQNPASITRP